ncbi:hypothetical protein [Dietzia sp. ANT_WB102]|uniref:hypothetical protein n=1 Tax=Dietzia sp. ANT_WB102 TaxID=2597345 RepID=UPI0011EDFD26|nr:hypothetical protein [Dietzia sp. ANT_WB102]KAA0918246.1 hypothetical protein FQ137_02435 [Dietzia sp. ANT_WB102]
MSTRSDRAAERKAVKQAEKELKKARTAAQKAFDLKDPRFLGEAAVAATRGPVGLALFGASRGMQVLRERRAEQAELLNDLAADARQHAEALREQTSALASPDRKRGGLRRFAPLWIVGLAGGAAVAGATAYFLRDQGSTAPAPAPAPSPTPTPTPAHTPTPAEDGPAVTSGTADSAGSKTGEDLTIDSADPEGPADQSAETSPAADSATPGPAAGSAPQPSDDQPGGDASADGTSTTT